MPAERTCAECGAQLVDDAPQGLCPKCLPRLGPDSSQLDPDEVNTVVGPPLLQYVPPGPPPKPLDSALQPGQQYGGYQIGRLLGKGGMGAAYEAEHLESARRVALKVLEHSLDSPETRKRFLREGRLAASVNHPNSVYIYGTEEIEGTPVIAMELVAGGTLKERVQQHGPLPVAEAVDVILQVIAGLEAAQTIGVLHRDIKPSNCFVDSDGTVKVGDFGLSISTLARGETNLTMTGAFMGTPAYSSPEQLRGEELDVRSDIYSVGVTLYYLLTGKTPFEGENLVKLLATVLEQAPESPAKWRRDIPKGLARVVLRCLEKQSSTRCKSYDELRRTLLPFNSTAPTAARLGSRLAAGIIDVSLWSIAGSLLVPLFRMNFFDPADYFGKRGLLMSVGQIVLGVLYFALPEGIWGASLGKALCRLRVVGSNRAVAGIYKASIRAAVFLVVPYIPWFMAIAFTPADCPVELRGMLVFGTSAFWFILVLSPFATARHKNGFAAIHDLVSKTRVISKSADQARPEGRKDEQPRPSATALPQLGPYHVLASLSQTDTEEWILGYDTRLLRKVWIHRLPNGASPVAASLRNLSRAGRLRWISGKRSSQECWDVYEALSGNPLLKLLEKPQPWQSVRHWLLDLAEEMNAASHDHSSPSILALDRVWITDDGRAKLLDFPAPGCRVPDSEATLANQSPLADHGGSTDASFLASRQLFLKQVAIAALEGRALNLTETRTAVVAAALPLHARKFLLELPTVQDFETVVGQLKSFLSKTAFVSRRRRLFVMAGCAAPALMMTTFFILGVLMFWSFIQNNPNLMPLVASLDELRSLQAQKQPLAEKETRQKNALEVYVAATYHQATNDTPAWSFGFVAAIITPEKQKIAEQVLTAHPNPTPEEIGSATTLLKSFIEKHQPGTLYDQLMGKLKWYDLLRVNYITITITLYFVVLPGLVCALLFRGGLLLHFFGIVIVKKDGSPASRLRIFWRTLMTWSLLLPIPFLGHSPGPAWIMLLLFSAQIIASVWSLRTPDCGLSDRLAGTRLVPR